MLTSKPSVMHVVATLALLATPAVAQLNALTYVGCFKNKGTLGNGDTYQFQTDGHCQGICVNGEQPQAVLGLTNGDTCLCGGQTPSASDKVDDSSCSTPCQGFGEHMCGGSGFYSVYLTGTQESVGAVGGGSTTGNGKSAPSSTVSAPSVITSIAPGRTVVVTQSANPEASQTAAPDTAKPNTTAIVAGVVVGVVAIAAIAGGAVFFMRRRRQQRAEQEYKQHQVADFMAGSSSKGSIPSRKPSGPDPRFDAEAMAHRRLSDGSIADNEDYSRRILKVTNPDDRFN